MIENNNENLENEPKLLYRLDMRNPLSVFFFIVIFAVLCLWGFLLMIYEASYIAKIIGFFLFSFYLWLEYSAIFFEYIKSYNDRIIIKRYFSKEIIIYRKDIITTYSRSSVSEIFGEWYSVVVKGKIGIKIYNVPCLKYDECWKI